MSKVNHVLSHVGIGCLCVGLFVGLIRKAYLDSTGGRDTAQHLDSINLCQVSSCCVPEFDPEGFRITMDRERRSIIHDCYWLGYSPVTQLFEKLRKKRSELVKLNEQATLINLSRWQLDRIARF